MTETEDRVTELELRFVRQQDLLEQLNDELIKANATIDVLEKRVARLESVVEGLVRASDAPANEKPPHY
jgi:SlyX protein